MEALLEEASYDPLTAGSETAELDEPPAALRPAEKEARPDPSRGQDDPAAVPETHADQGSLRVRERTHGPRSSHAAHPRKL
jgi:hypothetical protein